MIPVELTCCPLEQQVAVVVSKHPHLHQRPVTIRADHGHVTLRGRVQSFFEKQLAQEAVHAMEGVSSIDNQLEVVWPEPPAPLKTTL